MACTFSHQSVRYRS